MGDARPHYYPVYGEKYMTIGIVLHPYGEDQPAGLARTIFELSKGMLAVDRENEYIIFLKRKPRVMPEFPGTNWKVHILGSGLLWLDRLRGAPRCDVIIFNTPVLPLFYRPKRSVVLALDFAYYYFPPQGFKAMLMNWLTFWYHSRALRRADSIVAISEATKRDTVKLFNIKPEKIRVVLCGFKNVCAVPEQEMRLPEKFFLFVGVMKPRKNVFNVVRAFRTICKKYPEYMLLLGGRAEGSYVEEMKRYIADEGIQARVQFIGHLNDGQLSSVYRHAKALVFASFIEGFGYPVLEAMACGTPVITSRSTSLGEICQNNSALLVDPANVGELAAAMERIAGDDGNLREALITNGRLQAVLFSWEKAGREMVACVAARKICFLTHDLRHDYGAGFFSHRLIRGVQDNLGWDVVVLVSEASGSPLEIPILYPQKINLMREVWRIRGIMKECDIIHALDGFPYGVIAVLASLGLKKKIMITAAGSGAIIPLYHRIWVLLMRRCYRRADVVTAISAFTRSEILKRVTNLSIQVINHGVDAEEFKKAKELPPAIKTYQPYILGVGTLRWRKGYHFSLRSFAALAKEFPDLHYVIAGKRYKDDYWQRLHRVIEELGIQKRVHILEHIDSREDLIALYKGAELFCLFSQNVNHDVEGFGMVFLEAAAAGLPVVGAKNCGVDDAVQEGKNGLLVSTRDPQDFANALRIILRDKELQSRMRAASLAFARECTWERRIGEYIAVYKKLL